MYVCMVCVSGTPPDSPVVSDGTQTVLTVLAAVQRRKVWLTPTTTVPCSNAAKTRNPLKFAGVPQTAGSISAASGPKFTILWRTYCCLTSFFRLSIHALVAKT